MRLAEIRIHAAKPYAQCSGCRSLRETTIGTGMLRGIPPEITRANLDHIIVKLKERGATIILAGMRAAPSMGADFQAAFDPLYGDLAARHGVALYPFFLDGVATRKDLLLEDGMHPNAAGVGVIVRGILPLVEKAVADRPG